MACGTLTGLVPLSMPPSLDKVGTSKIKFNNELKIYLKTNFNNGLKNEIIN